MAPLRPSDQSLLDRLNALKPTSVSLDKTPNTITSDPGAAAVTAPTGLQPEPASREDALAARLRILRNGSASDSGRESSNAGPQTAQPHAEPFKPNSLGGSSSYPAVAQAVTQDHAVKGQQIDDPYIFETDDIDDLLDGLDDFDLDDDFEASGNGRSGDNEDSRVSNILESLKPTGPDKLKSPEDEDDSDGEHMSRDVEKILAEVRDEIHLERDQSDEVATSNEASANITTTNDDPTFPSLPGVPRSLPVDTALDQADDSVSGTARKSLDFENDITSRLASLRGVGSGMTFDSFGLPTAPTFSPEDRSASTAAAPVPKRGGYTDEDQKTWCIVCLDDATIRCIGCDNDVYCLRCWKEMHIGPSAGYDERGHQWAKFQR